MGLGHALMLMAGGQGASCGRIVREQVAPAEPIDHGLNRVSMATARVDDRVGRFPVGEG